MQNNAPQFNVIESVNPVTNVTVLAGEKYSTDQASEVGKGQRVWNGLLKEMESLLAAHQLSLEGGDIQMSPMLEFDPKSEIFTGSGAESANRFLRREYRKGFAVPEIIT